MKKIISVWLCMCIMIYIASPIGFAVQAEEQFSIEEYTLSDIFAMSPEEQIEILQKYEEVYDPFGLNTVLSESTFASSSIQPLWNSGNSLSGAHEWKTHEKITIQALAELEKYLNHGK